MRRELTLTDILPIIQSHFPTTDPADCQTIQSGWDSFVVQISGEYILRFPRLPEVIPGLRKEVRLIPFLQTRLPIAVPAYSHIALDAELPYVAYPMLPGQNLPQAALKNLSVLQSLGEVLVTLHSLDIAGEIQTWVPVHSPEAWRQKYLALYSWVEATILPQLSAPAAELHREMWIHYLDTKENFDFNPGLIHADLAEEHLLYEPQTARLTGIIDWEDANVGDPALDFVGLYWLGGWPTVTDVLPFYSRPTGQNFRARVLFYAALSPVYQIQYGLHIQNQKLIRQGLARLERSVPDENKEQT